MKPFALMIPLLAVSSLASAATSCEDLKAAIAAKLDAKNVSGYVLEILGKDDASDAKVVGNCEHGSKKIVYTRKKA
jgi:hypothetical protein